MHAVQSSLTITSSNSSHCLINTCAFLWLSSSTWDPVRALQKASSGKSCPNTKATFSALTSLSNTHTHIRMTAAVAVRADSPSLTPTNWAFSGAFSVFLCVCVRGCCSKAPRRPPPQLVDKTAHLLRGLRCWDNRRGQRVPTCSTGLVVIGLVTLTRVKHSVYMSPVSVG